jgi:hypothetical protein
VSENPYGASAVARAMAGSVQENAKEAVSARRVMDDRDFELEKNANVIYEYLRDKTKEQLILLCSIRGLETEGMGRQVLIASLIDHELLSAG